MDDDKPYWLLAVFVTVVLVGMFFLWTYTLTESGNEAAEKIAQIQATTCAHESASACLSQQTRRDCYQLAASDPQDGGYEARAYAQCVAEARR